MSKKRTSDVANSGEETTEDSVLQQDNAKRSRLNPARDKTLEDIPTRVLTLILAKAVAMEVIDMKLAKRVWNDKADLVIDRLKDVSLRWGSILATNAFLTEVHDILDRTAEVKIRMEISHQQWFDYPVFEVTTLKEEIYTICKDDFPNPSKIDVYHNHDEMPTVKDVITLPGELPQDIEACNVSNCVYVLCINRDSSKPSILRISKGEEHQFTVSTWITDLRLPVFTITASPDGNLIVPYGEDPVTLSIYDANGCLMSSADIHGAGFVDRVIQKSNGNLLLASLHDDGCYRVLTEIDRAGKVQRQYKSECYDQESSVNFADTHGRILIAEQSRGMKLLDSELNQLDFLRKDLGGFMNLGALHYNSENDEIMSTLVVDADSSFVTTFHFIEE